MSHGGISLSLNRPGGTVSLLVPGRGYLPPSARARTHRDPRTLRRTAILHVHDLPSPSRRSHNVGNRSVRGVQGTVPRCLIDFVHNDFGSFTPCRAWQGSLCTTPQTMLWPTAIACHPRAHTHTWWPHGHSQRLDSSRDTEEKCVSKRRDRLARARCVCVCVCHAPAH